jgi:hypothetical protein
MMDLILATVGVGSFVLGLIAGRLLWHKPITARTMNAKTIEERARIAGVAKQSLPKSNTPNG